MKNKFWGLFLFCALVACSTPYKTDQNTTTSPYKIINQIHLEGDGFWDYLNVDETTDRLYISHGTQVQIVDLKTGKLAGTVADTKGVHGIAVANDLGKGFVSCGRDTSVVVFDLKTLANTGKIKVTGENPDAILYDAVSKRVFTFNHNGKNATAIDAITNKVIGTIELEGEPEFAVTDGKGTIYVNLENTSEIAVFDSKTLKIANKWSVSPGKEPTGLAFDSKNMRLFSVCDNEMMIVLDAKSGKFIQKVPIGEGVDGVAFDAVNHRIYSSNGEGTMTIIEEKTPDQYQVLSTVPTQKGARTIAVNSKTHRLYLPTADREPAVGKERPKTKPGTFVILEIGEN
jgi:DNA-binding beta-propeller fold protein YncE